MRKLNPSLAYLMLGIACSPLLHVGDPVENEAGPGESDGGLSLGGSTAQGNASGGWVERDGGLALGGEATGGAGWTTADCGTPLPCEGGDGWLTQIEPNPQNILFVIERSTSMGAAWGDTGRPRLAVLTDMLKRSLTGRSWILRTGIELFPAATVSLSCSAEGTGAGSCCEMPGSGAAMDVGITPFVDPSTAVEGLQGVEPGGASPTAAALARAREYFASDAVAGLEGRKLVVLFTDGGPNCGSAAPSGCAAAQCTSNIESAAATCAPTGATCCEGAAGSAYCADLAATMQQVESLRAADIETVVVGLPGSERYREELMAMAVAGGTPATMSDPEYWDLAELEPGAAESKLNDLFTDIIASGLFRSCRTSWPSTIPLGAVTQACLDGKVVLPDANVSNGGYVVEGNALSFVGAACDSILQRGVGTIELRWCPAGSE